MARDIILKDRNGNPEQHRVSQIVIPGYDLNGNARPIKFTHLTGLYLYGYQPIGGAIKILTSNLAIAGDDVWFWGCDEEWLRKNGYKLSTGDYSIGLIVTTRGDLVVGNTYTTDEL